MAIMSQAEFARNTGKSKGYINVYVKRKKILLSLDEEGKAFIDTDRPENKKYYLKWCDEKKKSDIEEALLKSNAELSNNDDPEVENANKPPINSIDDPVSSLKKLKHSDSNEKPQSLKKYTDQPPPIASKLDAEKKAAEIRLKNLDIEKRQLEVMKMKGHSMPTDMTKAIVSSLGRFFQKSYKEGADSLILEIMHKLKAPPEVEAFFKKRLLDVVNISHAEAMASAKVKIENYLEDVKIDEDE